MADLSVEHTAKIATLEADLRHLTTAVERLTDQVATLNTIMERSRGVIWVITSVAGMIGFFLAKAVTAIPWGSLMPR